MDCRTFRRQHLLYTDLTLPPGEAAAMRAHADSCAACSRLHVALLRGLMMGRNRTPIAPSAGFGTRLRTVYSAHAIAGDARPQIGARAADVRPRLSLSR